MIIDFTDVNEAVGENTNYYGGILAIDDMKVCVDGWTDNTQTPLQYAFGKIIEGHDLDEEVEDTWLEKCTEEFWYGHKYEVSTSDEGYLVIDEIK